jgi:hypothetical protein
MKQVTKIGNKYMWDSGSIFTWEMHYNEKGEYIGQVQSDVYSEGEIFLSPEYINGLPCVNGKPVTALTANEMKNAN